MPSATTSTPSLPLEYDRADGCGRRGTASIRTPPGRRCDTRLQARRRYATHQNAIGFKAIEPLRDDILPDRLRARGNERCALREQRPNKSCRSGISGRLSVADAFAQRRRRRPRLRAPAHRRERRARGAIAKRSSDFNHLIESHPVCVGQRIGTDDEGEIGIADISRAAAATRSAV